MGQPEMTARSEIAKEVSGVVPAEAGFGLVVVVHRTYMRHADCNPFLFQDDR